MAGMRPGFWRGRSGFLFVRKKNPEYDRVVRALRHTETTLGQTLADDMEEEARRLADVARSRVRRLPVAGDAGSTGLRRRVARGVFVNRSRRNIRVSTSMPERDEAILPRGLDRSRGWRHPVFGDRDNWVRQVPYRHGWFRSTFENGQDDVEDRLRQSIEAARDRIDRAGGAV